MIKKGDTVRVIAGDERGEEGKVLQVLPGRGLALVEGINKVKRHTRAGKGRPKGGVIEKTMPVHISNLKKI